MRTVSEEPNRDAWTTQEPLARAIGEVDYDPCSNSRSRIRARRTFSLEDGQDGIALARFVHRSARTFVNPPFSHGMVIKFVRAYRHTRFTFLVRFDVSTEWWAELWPYVAAIATPIERVEFDPPPGVDRVPGSPFPHVLLYARLEDITPEVRRICYVMTKNEVDRWVDVENRRWRKDPQ